MLKELIDNPSIKYNNDLNGYSCFYLALAHENSIENAHVNQ